MRTRTSSCPSCGAPVEFQVSSTLVTVCDFCQCVVARGDKSVEDHGKVSDLVLTDTPLCRGITGRLHKRKFEILGRVQYRHPAGGFWDEWYLLFSNGKWGWLAEAQGEYFLTFESKLSSRVDLPDYEQLEPGQQIDAGKYGRLSVTEIGVAMTHTAEGEIPWEFREGLPHRFADLRGADQVYGTLDYSTPEPVAYLGRQIQLDDLHLVDVGWDGGGADGFGPTGDGRVGALAVNCPHCAGALQLHAPDETQRVCCPHCHSLLDCQRGNLEYLKTLNVKQRRMQIPLGTEGTLQGVKYTVIGFLVRFAVYEGLKYPWTEYLLKSHQSGFRWLVCNDGHWSFVEPVSDHEIAGFSGASRVKWNEQFFNCYDRGESTVQLVLGEFYWRVNVGDVAKTADFISPPHMLSYERSRTATSEELNISLGTYITPEEIEQAFGVENLTRPWGVGVIQPQPEAQGLMTLWAVFAGGLLLMMFLFSSVLSQGVDVKLFFLALAAASVIPVVFLLYRHQFEVNRWEDSDFSPYEDE